MSRTSIIVPPLVQPEAALTASANEPNAGTVFPASMYMTLPCVVSARYTAVPSGANTSQSAASALNMAAASATVVSVTGMSPSPSVSAPLTPMRASAASPPSVIVCPDARYTLLPLFPVICTAPLTVNVPPFTRTAPPVQFSPPVTALPSCIANTPPSTATMLPPPALPVSVMPSASVRLPPCTLNSALPALLIVPPPDAPRITTSMPAVISAGSSAGTSPITAIVPFAVPVSFADKSSIAREGVCTGAITEPMPSGSSEPSALI